MIKYYTNNINIFITSKLKGFIISETFEFYYELIKPKNYKAIFFVNFYPISNESKMFSLDLPYAYKL